MRGCARNTAFGREDDNPILRPHRESDYRKLPRPPILRPVIRLSPLASRLYEHKQRDRAELAILTATAGPMAEARYRGCRVAWHRLCGTDRAILDSGLVMTHAGGFGPECQAAYLAYLKTRAAEWLETLWPRIEVLADALIDRRELTGDEVDKLVRTVKPNCPPGVIDGPNEKPETPEA